MTMPTESGLEEFILLITDYGVILARRADSDSEHSEHYRDAVNAGIGDVVKAYGSEDWQYMPENPAWYDAVIIGYCERRITTNEEDEIRRLVANYWNLPF